MAAFIQRHEERLKESHRPTLAVARDVDIGMWRLVVPCDLLPGNGLPIFTLLAEDRMADPKIVWNSDRSWPDPARRQSQEAQPRLRQPLQARRLAPYGSGSRRRIQASSASVTVVGASSCAQRISPPIKRAPIRAVQLIQRLTQVTATPVSASGP